MAATPVKLYRAAASAVVTGGAPVTALFGPMLGGLIVNPSTPEDQGIGTVEVLFVDLVNPAGTKESATCVPIQPGQSFTVPAGCTTNASVNAATSGHKFSAIAYQPPPPSPTPQPSPFPPSGPVTVLGTIPSYLYVEYNDDEDLQAFVEWYNETAQSFLDWFNAVGLPIYTGTPIAGALLDWVAQGLYGIVRPSLSSGQNRDLGPFNTYLFNQLAFDQRKVVGPQNVAATSDDVFKRIITWNFFKGDGRLFNMRWLKRRVERFLNGPNGVDPGVSETYDVSVSFGVNNEVNINFRAGTRRIVSGSIFNGSAFDRATFDGDRSVFTPRSTPIPPLAPILKEAADSGALQFPFQFKLIVNVG